MTERRELLEVLKRVEEKLYAGWNLYSALAFLYWIPFLATYMAIACTSWYRGLSGDGQRLFSIAYWAATMLLSLIFYRTLTRKYLERLAVNTSGGCSKDYRRKMRCSIFSTASWLLGLLLAPAVATVAEPLLGPERVQAVGLLVFVKVGTLGLALAEYCASRRKPLSLVAPSITAAGMLLLPLVPPSVDTAYSFASSVIVVGYSVTAILYVLATLRRL